MNELKIVLILAARTFKVSPSYDEWDQLQRQRRSLWDKMVGVIGGEEINTIYGVGHIGLRRRELTRRMATRAACHFSSNTVHVCNWYWEQIHQMQISRCFKAQ